MHIQIFRNAIVLFIIVGVSSTFVCLQNETGRSESLIGRAALTFSASTVRFSADELQRCTPVVSIQVGDALYLCFE